MVTIEQLTLELINVDVLYGRFDMFQSFGLGSYQWDEYRNIL
jgi:hypothetical protein